MEKYHVTYGDIRERVNYLSPHFSRNDILYGVPRGGIPIAMYMAAHFECRLTHQYERATHFIDDIIDSGATRKRYRTILPDTPFIALYDKTVDPSIPWLVFPWEKTADKHDNSTEDIFVRLLEYIGEDPHREGLKDTPKRMAKAWEFWTQGYTQSPRDCIKTFEDGAEQYDQMILMKGIPFYSHCEHHLAPFFGVAHIAYVPAKGSVLGISKLGRILDIYARRLQIQERLTNQVADCIQDLIGPQGVAVVIEARHLCTESRGLDKQGHVTITSALTGIFREKLAARNEFMALIK